MRDWCIIYIGIIKIPLFKDVLVKNPSNCRLKSFINPGIVMIAVIEVPIIEDLLYFLLFSSYMYLYYFCLKKLYSLQNLPSNILASHSKIVSLQEEFSLTCQIRNALSHPIIKWYKDFIYQINASVAQTPDRITMDLRRDESYQNDFLAILFIKDASEMDAGTFTCRVCTIYIM